MGYADWHFMMKDLEENKGFRNAILTAIVLAFLIFIALFVWFKIEERKRDAVEMVFVEHNYFYNLAESAYCFGSCCSLQAMQR
ncbi:hypothetical protein T36_0587 [Helicobacter cinaedi]|uniref:hypothetical protein n=1 Tax=Helicobacter cinaedi TaxID=213 RepID=UPI001F267089|nr:hypothetical protein [Helicobacter cinaedi]BDB64140.1 hypothetical protein T36_0587 [Helicobacter cinaedi]